VVEEEPLVSSGMAATLALLQQKGIVLIMYLLIRV
jgi:hypothetical protein